MEFIISIAKYTFLPLRTFSLIGSSVDFHNLLSFRGSMEPSHAHPKQEAPKEEPKPMESQMEVQMEQEEEPPMVPAKKEKIVVLCYLIWSLSDKIFRS